MFLLIFLGFPRVFLVFPLSASPISYFRFSKLHNLSAILGIIFFVTSDHQLIEVQILIASNFSVKDTSFFSTLVHYACFNL